MYYDLPAFNVSLLTSRQFLTAVTAEFALSRTVDIFCLHNKVGNACGLRYVVHEK